MKIVYVLVSNETDLYLNQAVISINSLRRYMPKAEVILLVDDKTAIGLIGKRKIAEELHVQTKVINLPEEYNSKLRSRFLKMCVREEVEGDLLYVDCDTIFCGAIDEFDCEIGMVLDKHVPLTEHPVKNAIEQNAAACGFRAAHNDKHFNGGFMWVKDTTKTREFFSMWKKLYIENKNVVTQDQTSLNEVNSRMNGIITELPAEYNCQISTTGSFVQYLQDAKMLHYFASCSDKGIPYDLADEEILKKAFCSPIHEDVLNIIESPKKAFKCFKYAGTNPKIERMMQTATFEHMKKRYIKNTIRYRVGEKIYRVTDRISAKLLSLRKKLERGNIGGNH